MAMIGTRLVERLKDEALQLGTRGVRWVVEGTVTAVRTLDRLQELLPKEQRGTKAKREPDGDSVMEHQRREPSLYRPPPERPLTSRPAKQVRQEARATAELVLAEARAAKERLKKAQPAPHPLTVSADVEQTLPTPKRRKASKTTQGRKTTASATAPKRVTAPKEGFKAKRGQKHKH